MPPPMQSENLESPPTPPVMPDDNTGSIVGWAIAIIANLLFILIALAGYFGWNPDPEAKKEAPKVSFTQENIVLRQTLIGLAVQDSLSGQADGSGKRLEELSKSEFGKFLSNLEPDAAKHDDGAKMVLVSEKLAGRELNKTAITTLSKSKFDESKAVLAAVQGEKPKDGVLEQYSRNMAERIAYAMSKSEEGKTLRYSQMVTDQEKYKSAGMILVFIVIAGSSLIVWLTVLLNRAFNDNVTFDFQESLPRMHSGVLAGRFGVTLGAFFVGMSVVGGGFYALGGDQVVAMPIGQSVGIPLIVLVCMIPLKDKIKSIRDIWGRVKPTWKDVGTGLAGYLAAAPIFAILAVVMNLLPLNLPEPSHAAAEEIMNHPAPFQLIALFISAVVFAPLIEEPIFRGMLFPALKKATGKPFLAMLISGFAFAAIHPQGPLLWPSLAVIGMAASYVAYRSGSLWPAIILHAINNFVTLSLGLMMS
ncbi:MAG: CPBP family intramembrane metalloprotease [Armatimonadetes bacterium]|nr:CPBP family intramembrane metalloprotease [Armatimonadota bacterium]